MLSAHFSLEELTTTQVRGVDNTPNGGHLHNLSKTAEAMEDVRTVLSRFPIHVTSGYRSPELNKKVGGSPTSAHCMGWAVDFVCPKFGSCYHVCKAIVEAGIRFDQLILEYGWVHISFDPRMRGEVMTKKSAKAPYVKGLVP